MSSEPARVLRYHLTLVRRSVMKAVARLEGAEAEPELVESMHRLEDALDSEHVTISAPGAFLPWATATLVAQRFADVLDQIYRPREESTDKRSRAVS